MCVENLLRPTLPSFSASYSSHCPHFFLMWEPSQNIWVLHTQYPCHPPPHYPYCWGQGQVCSDSFAIIQQGMWKSLWTRHMRPCTGQEGLVLNQIIVLPALGTPGVHIRQ